MTIYLSSIKNTLYTNPNGVMDSVMAFALQDRIKSNTRLYIYQFDVCDLVEIIYTDNYMCVYEFPFTPVNAVNKIKEKLDFYANYFKSANLYGKRFLFDLSIMSPVNYKDFVEKDIIDVAGYNEFAFILDKKEGYVYGEKAITVFCTTERVKSMDRCLFSFYNNAINVISPSTSTAIKKAGCISGAVISGLSNGVSAENIKAELDIVDIQYKFVKSISNTSFNSANVMDIRYKLNINKLSRIMNKVAKEGVVSGEIVVKETPKGEVNLSDIILVGLDKFTRCLVGGEKDVIKVHIDCEFNTIRSAYIVNGTMFITPITMMGLSYFIELLNSDNIQYILT